MNMHCKFRFQSLFLILLVGCASETPSQHATTAKSGADSKFQNQAELNLVGRRALTPVEIELSENGSESGPASIEFSVRFCLPGDSKLPTLQTVPWGVETRKWGSEWSTVFLTESHSFRREPSKWLLQDRTPLFPQEFNLANVVDLPDEVYDSFLGTQKIILNIEIRNLEKEPKWLVNQIVQLNADAELMSELSETHEVILPAVILKASDDSQNKVDARILFRFTNY